VVSPAVAKPAPPPPDPPDLPALRSGVERVPPPPPPEAVTEENTEFVPLAPNVGAVVPPPPIVTVYGVPSEIGKLVSTLYPPPPPPPAAVLPPPPPPATTKYSTELRTGIGGIGGVYATRKTYAACDC